jgi:hypothetical protein
VDAHTFESVRWVATLTLGTLAGLAAHAVLAQRP